MAMSDPIIVNVYLIDRDAEARLNARIDDVSKQFDSVSRQLHALRGLNMETMDAIREIRKDLSKR